MLAIMGWRLHGAFPDRAKFIIAVAPHSSNIDFVLTMWVILSLRLKCSYLAKASLFRFPLSVVMNLFGGIPVDRSTSQGVVEQMAARFRAADAMILGITPEGTRHQVREWRSGFAQIAQQANVPVLPAIIDYQRKCVTFGPLIEDVADVEATLGKVQAAAQEGVPRRGRQAL